MAHCCGPWAIAYTRAASWRFDVSPRSIRQRSPEMMAQLFSMEGQITGSYRVMIHTWGTVTLGACSKNTGTSWNFCVLCWFFEWTTHHEFLPCLTARTLHRVLLKSVCKRAEKQVSSEWYPNSKKKESQWDIILQNYFISHIFSHLIFPTRVVYTSHISHQFQFSLWNIIHRSVLVALNVHIFSDLLTHRSPNRCLGEFFGVLCNELFLADLHNHTVTRYWIPGWNVASHSSMT